MTEYFALGLVGVFFFFFDLTWLSTAKSFCSGFKLWVSCITFFNCILLSLQHSCPVLVDQFVMLTTYRTIWVTFSVIQVGVFIKNQDHANCEVKRVSHSMWRYKVNTTVAWLYDANSVRVENRQTNTKLFENNLCSLCRERLSAEHHLRIPAKHW